MEVHIGEVAKISRAVFTPLGLLQLIGQMFKAVRSLDRVVESRSVAVVHSNTLAVLSGAVWAFIRRKNICGMCMKSFFHPGWSAKHFRIWFVFYLIA